MAAARPHWRKMMMRSPSACDAGRVTVIEDVDPDVPELVV
jgi:hypothetical protein